MYTSSWKAASKPRSCSGSAPPPAAGGGDDDDVHWQNGEQFLDALIDAGKPYELLYYPSNTHGISGPAAMTHLFTAMRAFWRRGLRPWRPILSA